MTFPTDQWQSASVDTDDSNNEAPDPGAEGRASFDIELTEAKAFVSKAGNAVIVLEMKVCGGPMDTYTWSELRGLKSEGQVKAAKATCSRLGVDVDSVFGLEDIEAQLKACVGNYYEIEVVQNGEWRNVYVQGRSGGFTAAPPADVPSKDEAAAAMAAAAADDKPDW